MMLLVSVFVMLFSSCQSIETSFGNKKENLDDILDDISSKYRVLNYTSDNTSIFMEVEDTENVNDAVNNDDDDNGRAMIIHLLRFFAVYEQLNFVRVS